MIFATTKERLLQYLDYKHISIANFFIETDIKRGFLDTDKLKSAVSDVFLAKIIAKYDDLNLYWLISGEGQMLKKKLEKQYAVGEMQLNVANEPSAVLTTDLIESLNRTISILQTEIQDLKGDKEKLFNLLDNKMGKERVG